MTPDDQKHLFGRIFQSSKKLLRYKKLYIVYMDVYRIERRERKNYTKATVCSIFQLKAIKRLQSSWTPMRCVLYNLFVLHLWIKNRNGRQNMKFRRKSAKFFSFLTLNSPRPQYVASLELFVSLRSVCAAVLYWFGKLPRKLIWNAKWRIL